MTWLERAWRWWTTYGGPIVPMVEVTFPDQKASNGRVVINGVDISDLVTSVAVEAEVRGLVAVTIRVIPTSLRIRTPAQAAILEVLPIV